MRSSKDVSEAEPVGLRSHAHEKRVQDISLLKGPVQARGEKQALVCLFSSPYLEVGEVGAQIP